MNHKIKKRPMINHNNYDKHDRLLHSRKSTYFYKKKNNSVCVNHKVISFFNLWWSQAHHHISRFWYYPTKQTLSIAPLILSSFALLLVLGLVLFPNISGADKASAATAEGVPSILDPDFSIQLSLNDTIQTEEELESGVIGYISNNFTITTKSASSYSIYLQPDTANNYTNKLIGQEHKQEIPGVGNNVGVGGFNSSAWGYGLTNPNETNTANSALTYSTIPDGSTPIKTVNNPDDGDDVYKLVFAAKINNDKPVDHYQSQAMLSVLASPKQVALYPTFGGFTYMQDPGLKNYCQTAPDKTSGLLADGRDNKIYWVTKLAGTCWMTQDLDLDLQGMTITNENTGNNLYKGSDVVSAWTGGNVASKDSWTKNNGDVQWYERDKTHGTAHTSLGNLYSFEAATAGTGSKVATDGEVATGSICPAGWKLPLSGNSSATGSFTSLKNAGMTSSAKANGDPYYFQYGGYIYGSNSNLSSGGNYWSATSSSSIGAYTLGITAGGRFDLADSYSRYSGYSVRCVVR